MGSSINVSGGKCEARVGWRGVEYNHLERLQTWPKASISMHERTIVKIASLPRLHPSMKSHADDSPWN